jgi:hypothetical protein
VSHGSAADDIVQTHEEAAANEREPLVVLAPLQAFLDAHGLGAGELELQPIGEGHSNVTYRVTRADRCRPAPTTCCARPVCSAR